MDEFDKALEYLDAPSTPTATPSATTETSSATTATPSISEVNNHNVDVMIGALKDLNVDVSKGEEGVLKGTMKGWKRASVISGSDASAPTIYTSRSTEANKKDEARKAASNRKREARRAALAAYEKERFKEQPNKQPEVKKTRSLFLSRRKSAPAGSLNAPVSPLSVPASSSELDLKKIDELEWRSFNTWVLDLASGLRDCSSSFNRIIPEESKEFKVEPLKNDETYNPYNPVYVIHYFKDFWDKIKGFYGAEKVKLEDSDKVKLEGSNEVDKFIKTIDKENWVDDGWDNPKFSTNPKAKEPELNKNNKVIKAFDGWLEIIKKNIINLQDKVGKKNIEKISESEKKWKKYNELVKKYNSFVAEQSKIVNSQSSKKLLERINKNDRKAQEIATRIVYPIFVDEKFEGSKGSKGSKSAEVLEKFLTEQAQKCEAGKAYTKYEKLKAILSDAEMIEGAGTLCTRLRDFYNVLMPSGRNLVATLLSGHANNIRKFSVNSEQLEGLEKEFNELLDGVERNIEDLGKVYDNVEKAYKDDKSIIGEDHDFIFGKDENNCWRVYQNEDGTEKEIGYIAKVYCEVVKKDEKQEKNVFLKDPNGGVIPYKGARTYGSVSSYLCGSMGYLSFENNFTPNGEIECYYTDEEGKENSVTFNANGMAIKINRQGKITTVNENSNTFKQLKQAFEGNQSSSTSPQGDLDINNNEKNEGGINMAGDESKEVTGKWTKAKPSGEKSGEDMIGTSRFLENQVRGTLNKYNRFAENYSKFVEDYNGFVDGLKSSDDLKNLITKVLKKEPEENSIWLNGDERNLTPEPGKTFNTIEELNKAWVDLINKLAEYLPEDNIAAYAGEVTKISRAIISDNDIDNSEKLKLMEKYNKMCDKMLNYTNSVLKRLEKEAKYEDPIEDDEEKSKGFFDKVKGKASKLVRKDKKVVAHKLDNSEKELDAAPKERKVADNYAGTNGTNVRFVKQSVMDQPEYAAFKAVGQTIVTKKDNFGKIFDELKKGPSSAKSLRSKLKVMITDNNIDKWKLEDGKEFEAKVGVLYIGIAYLPSGSKGIEAACKGMSVGGIKGSNDETIQKVYNVNRAMKKFCRDGTVGHALVKKVEEQLVALVNKDCIPKIESKFSTLLKLKRKAAKLGSKAKETAKKAATKIGKSSVGKAAKSAATTAGGGIKSAARSVKEGILKRIKGSKSKKDSVKQETGVIDLEKPNNRKKSSFWVKEDE